eukprot:2508209-Alexandrium_andersonii.AAC.1
MVPAAVVGKEGGSARAESARRKCGGTGLHVQAAQLRMGALAAPNVLSAPSASALSRARQHTTVAWIADC